MLVALLFFPWIGEYIRRIPFGILVLIPFGFAWVLSDIGTEDRSPIRFFRSFFIYQFQKIKGDNIYRGRRVSKPKTYQFANNVTFVSEPSRNSYQPIQQVESEKEEALSYIARINEISKQNSKSEGTLSPNITYEYIEENNDVQDTQETQDTKEAKDTHEKQEANLTKKDNKNRQNKRRTKKKVLKFKPVILIISAVLLLSVLLFIGFNTISLENLPFLHSTSKGVGAVIDEENNDEQLHEEYLLKGLRSASIQNYNEAVKHFEYVDYNLLSNDDKEIFLLSHLFSDMAEYVLELEPDFDEVVASYYVAKENTKKLKELSNLSDVIKFELAILEEDHINIIELKDVVNVEEEHEKPIVDAFLELSMIDEALEFAEERSNNLLINKVKKYKEENNDRKKSK